jgi:phage tail-like protein
MAAGTTAFRWIVTVAVVGMLALAVATVALAQQGGPRAPGPPGGYTIQLVVDGQTFTGFVAVEGLTIETEVIELVDASGEIVKIPGPTKYEDIVLKRGVTGIDGLWDWHAGIVDGVVDRRDGSVIVFDHRMDEVARYNFTRGWPSKWKGPDVNADSGRVLTEEITITVEAFEKG